MPKPQKRITTKQKNKAKKNQAISKMYRIGRLPGNPQGLLRYNRGLLNLYTMEAAEMNANSKMMMKIEKLKKLHPRISHNRQVRNYSAKKVRQAIHEAGDFSSRPRAFKKKNLRTKK